MLKSRGRTDEVSVMGMEGWPQVVNNRIYLFNRNKDYEYDQKGHSISNMKGVMPYAKRETSASTLC